MDKISTSTADQWSGLNEYTFIGQFFAFDPSAPWWENLSGCWEMDLYL